MKTQIMKILSLLLMVIVLLVVQNCNAEVKVEEKVLGPTNAGGRYVVADGGAHAAYVGMKGTHFFVAVDGAEGPLFDEFYSPTGQSYFSPQQVGVYNATRGGLQGGDWPVIFSDDGEHYAYAGRQGSEYVVIQDGNEIARGPRESLSLNYGALTISPKGRQVYWDEIEKKGGNGTWRLMMSGKPGPWSGHQTITPVFSPDESRYAYNAGKVENYQQQMFVVDGKEASYVGQQPVFTADNKLLLTVSIYSADNPKPSLLVNGKPVIAGIGVGKIIPGPMGSHYAAIVRTKVKNSMGIDTLFMDGKEVSGTDGVQNVWFSADGKHWAAACSDEATRSMFMVVDGKPQKEYQSVSVDKVYWTPDGTRFFYMVNSGGRSFLIANGDEIAITSLIGYNPIAMPEVGNRYAFATRDGSNRNFTLIIDGKSALPAGVYPVDNTIIFSPDGSRYGYCFGPVGRSEITGITIDGVVQPGLAPGYFGRWITTNLIYSSFIFSRDGKHVAYMGHTADPKGTCMYVDGKLAFPSGRAVYFPTFTPDSRHLFWAADEPAQVRGQQPPIVVYVDGQRTVSANGYFFKETHPWAMGADGAVTFLAADGDVVKRYRITATTDMSVDKFVTDAEANRAKALAEAEAAQKNAAEEAAAAKAKAAEDAAAAKKKAQEDAAATAAKRKADYQAAVAAKQKARQDALALKSLNAQRARKRLPPLKELPQSP